MSRQTRSNSEAIRRRGVLLGKSDSDIMIVRFRANSAYSDKYGVKDVGGLFEKAHEQFEKQARATAFADWTAE